MHLWSRSAKVKHRRVFKPMEFRLKSPFRSPSPHSLPKGDRLYAIGDIHGRFDLFEALLEKIEADNAKRGSASTAIILLGDLIDRGPDSAKVIDHARSWSGGFATMDALLGNHEASLLAVLEGQTEWMDSWLGYGGRETLLSYGVPPDLLAAGDSADISEAARTLVPDKHRDWLHDRPTLLQRGDYIFAHAGIRPGIAVADQKPKDLLWIRSEFLDSESDHGAIVVHGHSISPQPESRHNRIGIDTGAYFSNTLTALGLEGSARWFIQS
ncbi:metallophosphoesterase family protein [Parasphingopyxis lamellibrachiae]|uniref:Serine/threonine protein phosphatase 1 n=1 Tax=Parasphingopyxis lamellibrachiae TaxID=680125 RepID=A0A3D9FJK1_9SPHN|nr:metallophosphoesterase family protein [Parasphingopyxis lamellibrachiae]RED17266.1 serine/threonine protein phosphatase 1 [Parasphingopyxis lamellibrachiae]